MSLEQQIADLTSSIQELTAVVQGQSLGNAGIPSTPDTATPSEPQPATPAPSAPAAPAPVAVATPTPPAAVAPVAASPSEPAVTLAQLQQEVTAKYQQATPEAQAQIMATVQQYGQALTEIAPEHYATIINTIRAL